MRINRDVSALVERFAAHRLGGLAVDADGHQDFSVGGALSHGVVINVGEPDAIVGTDGDAVGAGENLLVAPAMEKFPAAVEDDDRGGAAVEHIDVALGADADTPHAVGPFTAHLPPPLPYTLPHTPP